MTAPADLAIGSFSDDPPWLVDPPAMAWRRRRAHRPLGGPRRPARADPAPPPARRHPSHPGGPPPGPGRGLWALGARRQGARPPRPTSPGGCASRPSTWVPPTSSWARSSPAATACSPRSWSASSRSAATRCRPSRGGPCARWSSPSWARPLESVFAHFERTPLAAASIAQVHAATPAHRRGRGGQGAAAVGGHAWCTPTSRSWPGWPPSWSGASPSPPWPTRRRWWSCSPRPSPRSSTSASRPPTCSTWPGRSTDLGQQGYVVPRPHPDAGHPPGAGHGAPARVRLRRRGRHAGGRGRHRRRDPHRHGRLHGGRHDPRHLPRRPARRQPVRAGATAGWACSTTGSSAGWTSSSAAPSCAC